MRLIIVVAVSMMASAALAQERPVESAVHRCGIQLGETAARMDSLGEEVDRLTFERDALKKELAASKAEAAKAKTELETAKKKSEKPSD
jgi:outer membrane murein-binding lipoprotein Lpp